MYVFKMFIYLVCVECEVDDLPEMYNIDLCVNRKKLNTCGISILHMYAHIRSNSKDKQ